MSNHKVRTSSDTVYDEMRKLCAHNSERLLKGPHHRHFLRKLIKVSIQTKILKILRKKTGHHWNLREIKSFRWVNWDFMVFRQNCIFVLHFSTFSILRTWKTAEMILIFTPAMCHYLKVKNFWLLCSFRNYLVSMIWIILFKRNIFITILEHDLKVIGKTQ